MNSSNKIPRSKLIIVSTGSLEDIILRIIEDYKLQKMVHLTGAADQEVFSNIMGMYDVSLLTSGFEGIPSSVLETLACGLPLATTNVGGVNKIVRNTFSGFVSENRAPEIICDLVINISKHQEHFKTENCVKSIKNYTAEILLNKIYSDYEKL